MEIFGFFFWFFFVKVLGYLGIFLFFWGLFCRCFWGIFLGIFLLFLIVLDFFAFLVVFLYFLVPFYNFLVLFLLLFLVICGIFFNLLYWMVHYGTLLYFMVLQVTTW